MSLKTDILRQLKEREGGYASGQALAERFGVTRAAVWKAVASLKKEGYLIDGTPNAGYRLRPSDVLDGDEIASRLEKVGISGVKMYVFSTLPSTNGLAEKLLGEGLSSLALVAAEAQTAGRARRGGAFKSDAGGLYMSLIFFPDLPSERLAEINERVYEGVNAVLRGERRENEIFFDGKKACGILTECVADPDRVKSCLAGIGVYTELLSEETRKRYPTRNALCAAICASVLKEV